MQHNVKGRLTWPDESSRMAPAGDTAFTYIYPLYTHYIPIIYPLYIPIMGIWDTRDLSQTQPMKAFLKEVELFEKVALFVGAGDEIEG